MDVQCIKQDDIQDALLQNGIDLYGTVPFSEFNTLIECRAKTRLPINAKSVIVAALPYYVGEYEDRNVSRYAIVKDYHDVFSQILQAVLEKIKAKYGGEYAVFSDISPIPEVQAAQSAGIGIRGDNNLIITEKYGSYVFIGEIVTDMDIEYKDREIVETGCLHCGLCKQYCPTQTLTTTFGTLCKDRNCHTTYDRCLSFITQKKGELTFEEQELIRGGKLAWGCDVCQDVCPMNKLKGNTAVVSFLDDIVSKVTMENVDELMKTRAFGYRGKKVITRNLELLK